jgi:hypothetical protein
MEILNGLNDRVRERYLASSHERRDGVGDKQRKPTRPEAGHPSREDKIQGVMTRKIIHRAQQEHPRCQFVLPRRFEQLDRRARHDVRICRPHVQPPGQTLQK